MAGRTVACLLALAVALTACDLPNGSVREPDRQGTIGNPDVIQDTARPETNGTVSEPSRRPDTPAIASAASVVESGAGPRVPFVSGSSMFGLGRGEVKLAEEPWGVLMGDLSPVASLSPDGRTVVYSARRELVHVEPELSFSQQGIEDGTLLNILSIRAVDLETGEDSLIAEGAFSAAFRNDGALAYFKGAEPGYAVNRRYTGQVVVRAGLDGPAEPWTTEEARYIVVAWAGPRLIVYREHCCGHLDILALDGPGEVRVLAEGEFVSLIALSPDGTLALIQQGHMPPLVRLIDVAGGTEVSVLDLSQAGPEMTGLSDAGSWVGDRVVAGGGVGGSPALVVLRVSSGEVAVEKVLSLDEGRFPWPLREPRFVDRQGTRVMAWAHVPPGEGAPGRLIISLDCDLASSRCIAGPAHDEPNTRPVSMRPNLFHISLPDES